jgi:ABC-type phosphate transport system auxiliary subunit
MKRKIINPAKPVRVSQVPATAQMLSEMEDRLSHKIDSKLHKIDSRFHKVDAQFADVKSDLASIKSELHRVALVVEDQNARNKFVLDGYAQLYELIERKLG